MAQIIYAPAVPILQVGGRVFTDLTRLIILHGYTGGGATPYTSFRKPSGSAGYAPSGVTFNVLAAQLYTATTAAASNPKLFYTDNDLGISSATAPTNQVYMTGSSTAAQLGAGSWTAGTIYQFALNFVIPASKFVGLHNGGTFDGNLTLFGYEV